MHTYTYTRFHITYVYPSIHSFLIFLYSYSYHVFLSMFTFVLLLFFSHLLKEGTRITSGFQKPSNFFCFFFLLFFVFFFLRRINNLDDRFFNIFVTEINLFVGNYYHDFKETDVYCVPNEACYSLMLTEYRDIY